MSRNAAPKGQGQAINYELGGIGVVNPTPRNPDGTINEEECRRHITWMADNGIRFSVEGN